MPAIETNEALIAVVEKSGLLTPAQLAEFLERKRASDTLPQEPYKLAQHFVFDGLLTKYQAEQLLGGRYKNFFLAGKYKLLEQLGRGGMASVFLCEHQVMKRLVAVKILPKAHGEDRELLGRFHREARALSQLGHPNIVAAYDVDHANNIHFLVMEYVDGGDLEFVVQKSGPMGFERAANYIQQASHGLQHAHEAGLVHRDIKPGNLLVDRSGTIKLLDLGLARIFHESTDDLTTGRDARLLLGTVDYLAPEQALNSHEVDIRADIYGLGATFHYLLTGRGLFEGGTIAQKLTWHLQKPPTPIAEVRPDVPEGLVRVIEKMLAKKPADRYQTPAEVAEALNPWTSTPIPPPRSSELPQLSLAARGAGSQPSGYRIVAPSKKTLLTTRSRIVESPLSTSGRSTTETTSTERITEGPSTTPSPASPSVVLPDPGDEVPVSRSVVLEPVEPPPNLARRIARTLGRPEALALGLPLLGLGLVATWAIVQLWPGPPSPASTSGRPSISGPDRPGGVEGARDAQASNPRPDASFSLVSGEDPPRKFPSLGAAIGAASTGDRIVVRGRLMSEAIEVSDVEGAPAGLTILADDSGPSAAPIRWRAPLNLAQGRALLDVSGLEGFHLKGFVLDGEGRIPELIRLAGRGAGSVIEEVELVGATRAGLVARAWAGESSSPATLRDVRFATDREVDAALSLEADADRPAAASESIRVESCRFVGPFHAAILIASEVEDLDISRSRFQGTTDGLRYRKAGARESLRARVANNVFSDLRRGIHFETTPPAGSSELVLVDNLFANTGRLATLDKVPVQPSKVLGRWIWAEKEGKERVVPAGIRHFRRTFDLGQVPDRARLDISCDDTFTVWLNGEEVGRDPSPHYTQRVFSFEVANRLRPGKNVLAVLGTNRPDPLDARLGTTAGLLVQLTERSDGKDLALARSDENWRWSDKAPDGWARAGFDDRAWKPASVLPDATSARPWTYAVWDSTVLPQLAPPLEPIRVTASGNIRDQRSWEGYPTLGAERIPLREKILPKDPGDDSTFLRLPPSHPLSKVVPGESAVGVSRDE